MTFRMARMLLTTPFMFLAACHQSSSPPEKNAAAANARAPIAGYKDITFGTSFETIIATIGIDPFNPSSIANCPRQLPLRGCYITRNSERASGYEVRDGIPYDLSLSFNRHDRLTDIELTYDKDGDITSDECRQIHTRTLDWLARDYGPMRLEGPRPGETARQTGGRTAMGNAYSFGDTGGGNWVSGLSRTMRSDNFDARRPIVQWDNERFVWLMTTFIVVNGAPECRATAQFREPRSVERRIEREDGL